MVEARRLGWKAGAALVVAAGAFLAWGGALGNGFTWDDHAYIVHNLFLRDPHNVLKLPPLGSVPAMNAARPVWVLFAMGDVQLWGDTPFGHHLTSLLLHILNALLVAALALSAGAPAGVAFLSAMIFALNPLAAESVCNATFRADVLAGLGMASATLCAVKASRSRDGARFLWLTACLLASGFALGAKETALVLPLLVLLWLCWGSGGTGKAGPRAIFPVLLLNMVVLGAVLMRAHWSTYRLPFLPGQDSAYPADLVARWQGAQVLAPPWGSLLSLGHLLGRALWPLGQGVDAAFPHGPFLTGFHLSLLAGILFLAWRLRTCPEGLGLGWALVAALPTAGLIPMPNPVADRYAYVPLMGLSIAAGAVIWRFKERRVAVSVLGLLVFAAVSRSNSTVWKNDDVLWRRVIRASPRSARAWSNAGALIFQASGRNDAEVSRAAAFLRNAHVLAPDCPWPPTYMGMIETACGDPAEAAAYDDEAVRLSPRPEAWLLISQGDAHWKAGDKDGATRIWRSCLTRFPGNAQVIYRLSHPETLP